jgi:hypothetical protein
MTNRSRQGLRRQWLVMDGERPWEARSRCNQFNQSSSRKADRGGQRQTEADAKSRTRQTLLSANSAIVERGAAERLEVVEMLLQ